MRVLDLFSGIGGFSLGLERTGMRTVAFCEIDPYCRRVLAKHWPNVPIFGDIRELTGQIITDTISSQLRQQSGRRNGACGSDPAEPRNDGAAADVADASRHVCAEQAAGGTERQRGQQGIDLICGGFPCQDISVAGKGAGIAGERSGLWTEYARVIGELRPRYVIVENVAAMLGRGLGVVLGDLAALGYDAEWHCIPASAVGAPHRRDRVWIVAYPASGRSEPDVCRVFDGLSQRLYGGLNGCDGVDSVAGAVGEPENQLRSVWFSIAAGVASQGSQSDEQLARKLADALPDLSHTLALGRGQEALAAASCFMQRMRQACTALGAVRDPQHTTQEAWQSLPQEEADRAFTSACGRADWRNGEWLGVGRVAHKVAADRVSRLRGLGNAVVPQIPEIIGRAIMQCNAGM